MKKLTLDQLLGIIRHLLTGIGMTLVTLGTLDAGMVEIVIGAVLSIVSVVWSVTAKKTIGQ